MNRDNEIDKLFRSFNPVLDTEGLMTAIKDKMDVIDMIRSEQENINRFNHIVSICCFAAGLSIGLGLVTVELLMPDGLYSIAELILGANMSPRISSFCSEYGDLVLTLAASASVILGILPMLNTFHGMNSTNSMVHTD